MSKRFSVLNAEVIGPDITRLVVHAPRVTRRAEPGQFVIVRATTDGERIPLTICDSDPEAETITLVVQAVGRTTRDLVAIPAGGYLADVLGPLGHPTDLGPFGTSVVVAGGVGTAIALPVAVGLGEAGNRVIGLIGARTAEHVILLDEMQTACDEVHVLTEDGSIGEQGLVTRGLSEVLEREQVDHVVTAGPIPMMAAVADVTRSDAIPTIASMNPIMVDGTGMCGGCRVSVGDATLFACVDGPEFDAHAVDFQGLANRNTAYRAFETRQRETCRADTHA